VAGLALAALGASGLGGLGPVAPAPPLAKLERALVPDGGVIRRATAIVGRSADGHAITARAINGDPGEGRRQAPSVLVFGCIHGDECAGIAAARRAYFCVRPAAGDLVVVRNLNPDGYALGTRLNGRGVDLNRNFAVDWRPIGAPGDPEHSGAGPFSEPETRVARRLIRALRPDVTIWFHQQAEPLVRAWGPSARAARVYARLAGLRFHRLPWMDGTAPNWQNNRFPGTSSFVVELPAAGPVRARRHAAAIRGLAAALTRGHDG
jgi:protein MpaA